MIIQTGMRTDIPAFYSPWFVNRLREGTVCVRNPYNPTQVTRYRLSCEVVDLIGFCTKNPAPMLPHMDLLTDYGQYWFVTITPYGRDIEPFVPDKHQVIKDFAALSRTVGLNRIAWRYDPIFINERYTTEYHLKAFSQMCCLLSDSTQVCVISFIDLYPKLLKNFPGVRSVTTREKEFLMARFHEIAERHGILLRSCGEGDAPSRFGIDTAGCMTRDIYEKALGSELHLPKKAGRKECACYLSGDIGEYNTCMHLCRYCYANLEQAVVRENFRNHDPKSPLLCGHLQEGDVIHDADQRLFSDGQLRLPLTLL